MSTLAERLDAMTVPAAAGLTENFPGGAVRCLACAHRCLIKPGRRGICQVRFNDDGVLKVPWGYVAALNVDPIEKKPFFHLRPGQDALTFGMLGCDFHCGYCFTGETMILTGSGPISLSQAFEQAGIPHKNIDGDIACPDGLQAITSTGSTHPVRAIFRHPYRGPLAIVQPYYLPAFRCTPDHKIYATDDVNQPPKAVPAGQLTNRHYLAIPHLHRTPRPQTIRTAELLSEIRTTYRIPWKLTESQREDILLLSAQGATSREIGQTLGKSASYIRHVRSKAARGLIQETKAAQLLIEDPWVRFPKEHRPGIPLEIPLDEEMARLLGYYCAEGSVVQSKDRPNSLVLNFSFSLKEIEQVEEVKTLLKNVLGVDARTVTRPTTRSVSASKASAALLFKHLAGIGAQGKFVPSALFAAPDEVIAAFLDAFVAGDGHRYENGKVSITTVSGSLAYGIGMLALALGYMPSIYPTAMASEGAVQGRPIQRAPHQYTVVWYTQEIPNRKVIRAGANFLIPLRGISQASYQGDVYNLEVEGDHTYLANLCLVANCQNWLTSQTLRDPACEGSVDLAHPVTAEQMVDYAVRSGAQVVASSYNEPLITSEWAISIFAKARQAGLKCVFVSNGNATPQALDALRPYLDGYKIDLKTMQDRQYRKLGGVLKNVLDTIQRTHDLGLWVEVVTLLIPGFNDSPEELWEAARFLASVSPDIPWHVTAFHPDYKMTDPPPTSTRTLQQAAEIGQEAGLRYVYAGNLSGQVGDMESTFCPGCSKRLIQRRGFTVLDYQITAQGSCPGCGTKIPGIWSDHPETIQLGANSWLRRLIR